MRVMIKNAKIIMEDRILDEGALIIEDGRIARVIEVDNLTNNLNVDEVYDAQNKYLMPGMIDIHSDAIEKAIEPRPNSHFPYELAISQLERMLVSQGISTIYHSLSFANAEGVREDRKAKNIIEKIKERPHSVIRNLVHMRYEITNFENRDLIEEILNSGQVELFSLMDHSPGQGQYKNIETYFNYVQKTYHFSQEKAAEIAQSKIKRREEVVEEELEKLLTTARENNIALASHDDDNMEKVNWARSQGVNIMEFPMTKEVAKLGSEKGMYIAVGAPNIVRGGSHNGNLSAIDLIAEGYANIICSDYYSACMLLAVLKVADRIGSLVEAVKMVTLNPAQAVGQEDISGSIVEGKRADLIIFSIKNDYPVIERSYVNGKQVCLVDYWNVG